MSQQNHRSPSRLARPNGDEWGTSSGGLSPGRLAPLPASRGNGNHRPNTVRDYSPPEMEPVLPEPEDEVYVDREPVQPLPARPLPPVEYDAQRLNELSKQERHELLMHTIHLYEDEWKLGGIRANEETGQLRAYLMPRNKRLDLKTAISRRLVLIITIDSQGNTDIKEPDKPGPLHRLTSWFTGD